MTTWRGKAIPNDIVLATVLFGPMRGDEVFTEELATAIARRDERCFALARPQSPTGISAIAVVLEDDRTDRVRWTVETAAPRHQPELHHALLRVVCTDSRRPGTIVWRPPTTVPTEVFVRPEGSVLERTILEMHAVLPLESADTRSPFAPLVLRTLAESLSNTAKQSSIGTVIRINNAAFADHPEQGRMSSASFNRRSAAPWFDPHGLTIATLDGNDVGFVWMKCAPPRPAELYVVAVAPGAPVKGLGRFLCHEGFAHAVSAHGATEAMLFVDSANHRAVGLYESLGFRAVRRQDVVRLSAPEA